MTEKRGRLIAHTGCHGAGKTYSALGHAQTLMKSYPSLRIGLITGVVRSCPFKINQETSYEAQLWCFSELIQQELLKRKTHDVVVSDRAIYDMIAYTVVGAKDFELANWMMDFARQQISRYDELWFHPANLNEFCYGDGLRDTDITFRGQIDSWLSKFYADNGINYGVVKNGVMI